jgi:hypothetical protein
MDAPASGLPPPETPLRPLGTGAYAPPHAPDARFALLADADFDRLDALAFVYVTHARPRGAAVYYVHAPKLAAARAPLVLLTDEPARVVVDEKTLHRARTLNAERATHARAIADARTDEERFLARARATRCIARTFGLGAFATRAELPSVVPLVVEAQEHELPALFGLARYFDDAVHCLVCAFLVGYAAPNLEKLVACIGTALVRGASGTALLRAAKLASPWLEWLAKDKLSCAVLLLVGLGARYTDTLVGDWVAHAAHAPSERCAGVLAEGVPPWIATCASAAFAILEIWRAVHQRPETMQPIAGLASRAALRSASVDAAVDRILELALGERAAEVKRRIPRRLMRTVLAVAFNVAQTKASLRDALAHAVRALNFGFAEEIVKCAV